MDLCEALVQLHYHGITHNDVTIRNAVKVKDRFKLIDFDVARMTDKSIDLSLYSEEDKKMIHKHKQ